MSFPAWGDGQISWQDAIPVYDESGKPMGLRAVDCEVPE
jgi:hypothetical protein